MLRPLLVNSRFPTVYVHCNCPCFYNYTVPSSAVQDKILIRLIAELKGVRVPFLACFTHPVILWKNEFTKKMLYVIDHN